ncbi:NnrS family protein [Chitinibacter sp. GC72]|uniref:NnrS family protein n=1 Tax=Chitinibacter sp. GC72 TaxID=1526917 RepID=UPI0012FC720A|nr:NnrS family protein [Chitinibacter sp. GC72]
MPRFNLRSPLLQAPHRLGFLAGGVLLLASLLVWALEMLSRSAGFSLTLGQEIGHQVGIPAMLWHGYLMIYGFFPLFMLGFIYTAGPRWLNVPSPSRRQYVPVLLLFAMGSVLDILGRWLPACMLVGVACHALAWLAGALIWCRAVWRSPVPDKTHALLIAIAFALGGAGMLAAWAGFALGQVTGWRLSITLGVWGFLLPVFLVVSHRMIPFFSANVLQPPQSPQPYIAWRPLSLLYTLGGLLLLRIILEYLQLNTLLADLPLAVGLLYTSWRWQLRRSFQVKLLAMLHAAFAWAGLGMTLFVVSDVLQLLGQPGLGFAPLHALTLGFFCTMLLAFVTRVTLGHSGRPLLAGGVAWVAYWAMHGVALARVLGEIIPAWQGVLYLLAALAAGIAVAAWSRVYLPMYWQARADGQPG